MLTDKLPSPRCEICDSSNLTPVSAMEMMQGQEGPFEYLYCENCETTYQPHKLEDYGRFYDHTYYSFKFKEPVTLSQKFRQLKRRLRNRYYYFGKGSLGRLLSWARPCPENHLSHHVKLNPNTAFLEIGCGSGELLHELADIGLRKTVGIDPFVGKSFQFKNGASVFKSTIYDLNQHIDKTSFDVILFNHSLEHSLNPIGDLTEASKYLSSTGVVVVRTPLSGSELSKKYQEHWWGLDAPRHVYIFSKKSMPMIAEKCGLKIQSAYFEGTIDDFLASEQHRQQTPLMAQQSYVVSKKFDRFSMAEMKKFSIEIAQQNKMGTAAQAGFVFTKS